MERWSLRPFVRFMLKKRHPQFLFGCSSNQTWRISVASCKTERQQDKCWYMMETDMNQSAVKRLSLVTGVWESVLRTDLHTTSFTLPEFPFSIVAEIELKKT